MAAQEPNAVSRTSGRVGDRPARGQNKVSWSQL
jgi:hypothetical protein